MKDIFEINAPGIDAGQILHQIEERVAEKNYDPRLIRKIDDLDFTPLLPTGEGGFHPAVTTELFERPVSPPDFSSRKYRLGPFRRLALSIFQSVARLYNKLSQNKIQAFYNVVHELIVVNHRLNDLERRYRELIEEHSRLRTINESNADSSIAAGSIPEPDNQVRALNQRTITLLETFLQRSTRIQVLESGIPYLTMALREAAFTNLMGGSQQPENGHLQVGIPVDVQLAALPEEQLDALLIEEVANLSVSIDALFALARSRIVPGGLLYLRHVRGFSGAVFIPTHRFIVDFNLLVGLLERQGFEVLHTVESGGDDGLLPGSFHLILRRL